jgi:hypothetical protein
MSRQVGRKRVAIVPSSTNLRQTSPVRSKSPEPSDASADAGQGVTPQSPAALVERLSAQIGNQRVARLLTARDGDAPTLLRQPTKSKTKAAQKTAPDAFILSRFGSFNVTTYADMFLIMLERKKHPWYAEYTRGALAEASLVALVRSMYETDLEPEVIYSKRLGLAGGIKLVEPKSGTRLSDDDHPDVQPWSAVIIDRSALDKLATALSLSRLSDKGARLEHRRRLAEWLVRVLVQVARRWGTIRPALPQDAMRKAHLSEAGLFGMLRTEDNRRDLAHLATSHSSTQRLRDAFDAYAKPASGTSRPPEPDSAVLSDAQWAVALVELVAAQSRNRSKEFEKERERARKHALNEALRPHEIEVEDAVKYVLKTFDPKARITVDFMGPAELKAGERITNVKGHSLFLLTMRNGEVIYQNEKDKKFYRQSVAGIEHELRFGVYALVAEKTKNIIPMTQWIIRVTGAIFPVAGHVFTASNILHVAGGLYRSRDELERLWDQMVISRRNIEKLAPGMVDAALAAGVSAAGLELFRHGNMKPAWDEWFIAAVKILRRSVAKSAGAAYAPEAAVTALKKIWAAVKPVLGKLEAIAFWTYTIGRPAVSSAGGGTKGGTQASTMTELANRLAALGLTKATEHAALLLTRSSAEREQLARELGEFARNGSELLAVLKRATSW